MCINTGCNRNLVLVSMKKILLVFCALFFVVSVQAENEKWQAGARSVAMGDASLANRDVWAGFNNPAALTGVKSISAGLFYENRFMVSELSYAALAVVCPIEKGVFALNYSRFGYSVYNENRVGLAYAMPLARWLSMGIQFDYLNAMQPKAYGNSHVLSFDIGLLAEPVENFFFAAHIFNPANISLDGKIDRNISTAMRLGLAYQFGEKTLASVETESDINTYTTFKAGVEYHLFKQFVLMTGFNVKPIKASFGAAYECKNLRIDLAYSYHQQLGNSPHLGISYAF